ncbi:MAG TPA: hypothetical protein VHQ24_18225 [Lachnospiraceae bacterium]|nr:hypothetical protein [Lachnospiraceae bacterium]
MVGDIFMSFNEECFRDYAMNMYLNYRSISNDGEESRIANDEV